MHIAFFDSGLGGLSILEQLLNHPATSALTIHQCSYIADTQAFPYGNKNDKWLAQRIVSVITKSLQVITPDLVVIACNTASTLALDQLRRVFTVPFIGVVPAVKPAALLSKTGVIGVLATPATIARDYTAQLITDYAPKSTVILSGSSDLVIQAENKMLGRPVCTQHIASAVHNLLCDPRANHLDTIVLACTHFPLLKEELIAACPKTIHWVDSGEAIARRVVQVLSPAVIATHSLKQQLNPAITLLTTGGELALAYEALKTPNNFLPCNNPSSTLFETHKILLI